MILCKKYQLGNISSSLPNFKMQGNLCKNMYVQEYIHVCKCPRFQKEKERNCSKKCNKYQGINSLQNAVFFVENLHYNQSTIK